MRRFVIVGRGADRVEAEVATSAASSAAAVDAEGIELSGSSHTHWDYSVQTSRK